MKLPGRGDVVFVSHRSQRSLLMALLVLAASVPASWAGRETGQSFVDIEGQRITPPLSATAAVKNSMLLLIHDRDGKDKLVLRIDEGPGGQSLEAAMGQAEAPTVAGAARSAYFELPASFDVENFRLAEAVGPKTVLAAQAQAKVYYRDAGGQRVAIGEICTTPAAQDPYSRPWVKLWFGADIRATPWNAELYLDLKVVGVSLFSSQPVPAGRVPQPLEARVQGSRPQPQPAILRQAGVMVLECLRTTPPLGRLLEEQYLYVLPAEAGRPPIVRVAALDSSTKWSLGSGWIPRPRRERVTAQKVIHQPPEGFEIAGTPRGQPGSVRAEATRLFFRDPAGSRLLVGTFLPGAGEARVSMAAGAKLAVTRFDAKILIDMPAQATYPNRDAAGSGASYDGLRDGQNR